MGLAFTRYILRVPPVSTATPAEIGRWAGPTLDRYMLGGHSTRSERDRSDVMTATRLPALPPT